VLCVRRLGVAWHRLGMLGVLCVRRLGMLGVLCVRRLGMLGVLCVRCVACL
jgi:hypothetical protein